MNLVQKAKLNATLASADAAVMLDPSTLPVRLGSLAKVAGGSFLNVNGNLAKLDNDEQRRRGRRRRGGLGVQDGGPVADILRRRANTVGIAGKV